MNVSYFIEKIFYLIMIFEGGKFLSFLVLNFLFILYQEVKFDFENLQFCINGDLVNFVNVAVSLLISKIFINNFYYVQVGVVLEKVKV